MTRKTCQETVAAHIAEMTGRKPEQCMVAAGVMLDSMRMAGYEIYHTDDSLPVYLASVMAGEWARSNIEDATALVIPLPKGTTQ